MMLLPLAAAAVLWLLLSRTAAARRALRLVLPGLQAKTAAILLTVAAMLVAAHGNLWAALCLFGASLWSLGQASRRADAAGEAAPRSPAVEVWPVAGGIRGRVLSGRHAGRDLDALDREGCLAVYRQCAADDDAGRRMLEAYLDRRFPGWRPAGDGDADARRRSVRFTNEMTEEQAYQVLGLGGGATRADVVRSHRLGMKRWHPDQGGTAEQAARLNEAKEVLLRRHH